VKIAAIGTLADVVPLVGENRVIARLGLEQLSKGPHKAGLRALIESAGLAGKPIDSYHVSFMLAPRVNAAGRMSSPDLALRLLLAADDGMIESRRWPGAECENERRQQEDARSWPRRAKSSKPTPTSGARAALSSPATAGHRGSSASWPRGWSTPFTGPSS